MTFFESSSRSSFLLEHDLFRKPVPTFGIMLQGKSVAGDVPEPPACLGIGLATVEADVLEGTVVHAQQHESLAPYLKGKLHNEDQVPNAAGNVSETRPLDDSARVMLHICLHPSLTPRASSDRASRRQLSSVAMACITR